jgi:UDP-N-acetyl-D-glucosamine dehydrogenase
MTTDPSPTSATAAAGVLHQRIETKVATVGIVGLGYVGLPLARAVHEAGYPVLGYDVDQDKIDKLAAGENYLKHLGTELVETLTGSDRFSATTDASRLADADLIILCVPTPLGPHREPDLSFVLDSTRMVASVLRPGHLVVLESTTYPGTTRGEMLPILESGSAAEALTCGRDFFVAYSPEREDPGRANTTTSNIPKLVGGVDDTSTDLAVAFYSSVIEKVHRVGSAEVAEAAKLLENIYRAVNIAMVNEMKTLLAEMDTDIWEVIDAAATKPFGFEPFFPGPGLGGHCIPIDPFYLTWKALNDATKPLRGSKVLVVGVAYKPNVDDVRESPAAEITDLLHARGAVVTFHDPHVKRFPRMRKHDIDLESIELTPERLAAHDAVLIVTNHDAIDYGTIGRHASLVVDTRNAMDGIEGVTATVVKA